MNSNQGRVSFSDREKGILKLFFQGGLQTYIPRDEAQIYLNNVFLDSVKFCVKDFGQAEPSAKERNCVNNYLSKNYQLLNSNLN